MTDNKEAEFRVLKLDVEALKGAMERVMAGATEDHAKWVSFKQFATDHHALVRRYAELTGEGLPCYDPDKLKGWSATVWPMQKQIFDGVYAETMRLHGRLANRAPQERPTGFDDLLHPSIRTAAIRHYQVSSSLCPFSPIATRVFARDRHRRLLHRPLPAEIPSPVLTGEEGPIRKDGR